MRVGAGRMSRDFHRLWGAYAISQLGSAVGAGALPLIAVLLLNVPDLQVSLLAALSGVASAAVALPLGSWIEFRRKRPVMIGADLLRFAALGSVGLAAALDGLTFAHLCAVGVAQTAGTIVFNAASGAHLKALVPAPLRTEANSRIETTFWTATTTGPPIGGLLIAWLGATATVIIDAISYLLSALGIHRLRTAEAQPAGRVRTRHPVKELASGWHYIFRHPGLTALFWNAMIFGGSIMLISPLLAVLMLRDLGYQPWQYGLALGLPGLGGVLGSLVTKPLVSRFGQRRVLLTSGVLRVVWMGLIPLATPGTAGLVVIIAAETLALFGSGVFNPTFATYRMEATSDHYMSRVGTCWSVSSKCVQPVFIIAGGFLAAATSARTAIAIAAVVLVLSAALLPWRAPSAPVPEHAKTLVHQPG